MPRVCEILLELFSLPLLGLKGFKRQKASHAIDMYTYIKVRLSTVKVCNSCIIFVGGSPEALASLHLVLL